MAESLKVATGGTVPRGDRCEKCGRPMLYRVGEMNRILAAFCGYEHCEAFLSEIEATGGAR